MMSRFRSILALYGYNLLIGIDQFANVILGGAPDQTISSRCWKHRDNRFGALAVHFVDFLFSWREQNHCQNSYESGDHQDTESLC
jgi:hypothetical protein